MKKIFNLQKAECLYCGHHWYPRKEQILYCPKCHCPVGQKRKQIHKKKVD